MTRTAALPATKGELALPSPGDALLIVVAICAVSTSAPIIAATAVPAVAIAFWRNAMATTVLAPFTLVRRRARLRSLTRAELRLSLGAGVLLAAHFVAWTQSVRWTSITSSTALVATQPVWTALLARRQGARIVRLAWVGIGVSVAGAALLTGFDFEISGRALTGDVLALVGALFAAAYVTAGSRVRQTVDTTTYTTLCYGTTAVVLLFGCLLSGQALAGYRATDWLRIAGLAVGAQLLGHSMFNRVLEKTSATVVSLAILFEVPGATIIAAIFLHQHVPLSHLPAAAVLLGGLALVVRAGGRAVPAE
jgi:drug/metabolite transporter (DMT)-like permease